MTLRQIYWAKAPLKRLPYLLGNIGLVGAATALFEAVRLLGPLYPSAGQSAFYISVILSLVLALYAIFLSLRRLLDIGFYSWNAAGFLVFVVGNMAQHLAAHYPLYTRILLGTYYLAMLLIPSASIRTKATISPDDTV